MDLVLWRHAEAQEWGEGCDDMARPLTSRGEKQAARMAAWLERQLPEGARIFASPAKRADQTAIALGRKYKTKPEISPLAGVDDLLTLVDWPEAKATTLVIGHQPTLGLTVSHLLGVPAESLSVRKGGVWWLRHRIRDGVPQTLLLSVQSPDLM
jgi:phosphohistidine phosphatase